MISIDENNIALFCNHSVLVDDSLAVDIFIQYNVLNVGDKFLF